MAGTLDGCLSHAKRSVADALGLDSQERFREAYCHYLSCMIYISTALKDDAWDKELQNCHNDGTTKLFKLLQHCLERSLALLKEHGQPKTAASQALPQVPQTVPQPGQAAVNCRVGSQSLPSQWRPQLQHRKTWAGPPPSFQSPQQVRQQTFSQAPHRSSMISRSGEYSPVEHAQQRNRQIASTYKSGRTRCPLINQQIAAKNLSKMRKMAENMSIAQAHADAIAHRRHQNLQRLRQEVDKKFTSFDHEGKEEFKLLYTTVLEYEQENKWSREALVKKLKESPDDSETINYVVTMVLRSDGHPITKIFHRYQYGVWERINALLQERGPGEVLPGQQYPIENQYTTVSNATTSAEPHRESVDAKEEEKAPDESSSESGRTGEKGKESDTQDVTLAEEDLDYLYDSNDSLEDREAEEDYLPPSEKGEISKGETSPKKDEIVNEYLDAGKIVDNAAEQTTTDAKPGTDGSCDKPCEDKGEEARKDEDLNKPGSGDKDKRSLDTEDTKSQKESKPVKYYRLPDLSEAVKIQKALEERVKDITADIRFHIDNLLTLLTVIYEELNTAVGREQSYATLESFFFEKLWPYLLSLFKRVNYSQEVILAHVITNHIGDTPEDMEISTKLCLTDQVFSQNDYPYKMAVDELYKVVSYFRPADKLDCVVKTSKVIGQCIQDYSEKKGDAKNSKVAAFGSDDLIPIFGYVVIKCGLPQIISECNAMEEFIPDWQLNGEEGFCLVTLQTVLAYLSTLDTEIKQ